MITGIFRQRQEINDSPFRQRQEINDSSFRQRQEINDSPFRQRQEIKINDSPFRQRQEINDRPKMTTSKSMKYYQVQDNAATCFMSYLSLINRSLQILLKNKWHKKKRINNIIISATI